MNILYQITIFDDTQELISFLWASCGSTWPSSMNFYCGPRMGGATDMWLVYNVDTDDFEFHMKDNNIDDDLYFGSENTIYPHDLYYFCDESSDLTEECMETDGMGIFLSLQTDFDSFTHMSDNLIVSSGQGWANKWELQGDTGYGDITLTMASGTGIAVEAGAELTLTDGLTIELPSNKGITGNGKVTIAGSNGNNVIIQSSSASHWGTIELNVAGSSIDYATIDKGANCVYATKDDITITNSTITDCSGQAFRSYSASGIELEDNVIDGSDTGVYIDLGDAVLEDNIIDNIDGYGVYADGSDVQFGIDNDRGYNQITDSGDTNLYVDAASLWAGGSSSTNSYNAIHDPYYVGYYVESINGSDVDARYNWWGVSSPGARYFYVDGESTLNHSNELSSDPFASKGGGAGPPVQFSEPPPEILNGDTRPGSVGRFVRYLAKLRRKEGRSASLALLSNVVRDREHPQRDIAVPHYVSDLVHLDETLMVVDRGEAYLLDGDLSQRAKTEVARLLFQVYTGSVKSLSGASRMRDYLALHNHKDVENGIVDFIFDNFTDSVGGSLAFGKREAEKNTPDYSLQIDVNAYPNPFRNSTTIQFTLEESREMSLVVYDVLGREVQRLVHAVLSEGYYRFNFNPGEYLAQGLYYYRLESGQKMKVGKLIFMK